MWTEEPDVDDLRLAQKVALALAGTVPIPSPIPATGLVLVGKTPAAAPAKIFAPKNDYYVRIVQYPGLKLIVSSYVALADVRLVKGSFAKGEEKDKKDAAFEPKILVGAELITELEAFQKTITVEGPLGELIFAEAAIVYVPAGAWVQVRTDRVTTAEEHEIRAFTCDCCNCPEGFRHKGGDDGHKLPW